MRATSVSAWVWLMLLLLGGCADERGEPQEAAPAADGAPATAADSGAAPPPGLDLAAVVRRVHFSFRPEGDAFTGGHSTYGVEVGPQGRIQLTPCRRAPDVEGSPPAPVEQGAPLALETVAVERGGASLLSPDPYVAVADDGSLAISRGATVERLHNGDDGVEQSWAFAAPPVGQGDLTVRVRPSGQAYVGQTEHGHHFADPGTGLGFRYGLATWIDASGARTSVDVEVAAGDLVLTVPHDVLAASSFPAVLDPTVGPESGVDTPVLVGAPGPQFDPAVAFDGSNYLVVWTDDRSARQIVAARVNRNGTVLDPAGFVVNPESEFTTGQPDVAFGGSSFLVVWRQGDHTRGARVTPSGSVLDSPSTVIIPTAGAPAVTFGGGQFLVAAVDSGEVLVVRVTTGGEVLGSPNTVDDAGGANPALAFDGVSYLVAWDDVSAGDRDILAARVSLAGEVINEGGFVVEGTVGVDSRNPDVAFDGSRFLIVYDDDDGVDLDVRGRFANTDGTVDTAAFDISATPFPSANPSVAYDGTRYLVAWDDDRFIDLSVFGARVSVGGQVLDPTGLFIAVTTEDQHQPDVVFDGTNFFVVWTDERFGTPGGSDIRGARVSTTGTTLDPTGPILSTVVQSGEVEPAAAFDGTNYLVAWTSTSGATTTIRGARVSPAGVVLDPTGLLLTSGLLSGRRRPALAWNGKHYLVVWEGFDLTNDADVLGARVTSTGVLVDSPDPIPIATGAGHAFAPSVAAGGGTFFVAWQDLRPGDTFDIYGGRVSKDGAPLDGSGLAISTGAEDQVEPSVAFGSSAFLVAWSDFRSGGFADVRAARVSSKSGNLLDGPASSGGFVVSGAPLDQARPAVASSGSGWFVAWEDRREGGADVYGTPVSGSGVVASPEGRLLSGATGDQTSPAIAYHGKGFMAVWEDRRGGGRVELFGARLSKSGSILDPDGFLVASGATDHLAPALAARSGQVLCADSRFLPAFQEERILTRFIKP